MSLAALAACALLTTPGAAAQEPADSVRHPLDPLTAAEYRTVVAALGDEAYLGPVGLYPLVTLQEPPKDEVLAWRPGDPVARRALVVAQTRQRAFEGVVDLADGAVVSWRELEGEEPPILLSEEWWFAQRKVLGDAGVRDALARRGITEIAGIVCLPHTVGHYGTPEERGRRLVKVACYDGSGTENYWGRPIEGLIALVDLGAGEVVRVVDAGAVPMPRVPAGYDEASVGPPRQPVRPIELVRPEGPSFEVEGRLVRWQKWRFRFRIDPRVGPVVSTVRYEDERGPRSVLYQGSLSELFVPYMDPSVGWYFRTYMDAGEYGMGKLAVELEPELDCPGDARFFGAVFADDWGEPYERERVACLFERYAGDAAWRHSDAVTERTEVRRSTELVLRSVSVVGNYDYTFDWVFRQDGSIRVAVGTSGIPQVKAVAASRAGTEARPGGAPDHEGPAEDGPAHGRLVGEGALAVNHDHFFSFRLDLDVDGRENSFVVDRLRTRTLPPAGPRKSLWVLDSRVVPTERAARLRIDIERPALWRRRRPRGLSAELRAEAGDERRLPAEPRGLAAAAGGVHRLPPLGHSLRPGRETRRRRLPPERGGRRASRLDGRGSPDPGHRHRRLVHARLSSRRAGGGLAGAPHDLERLRAPALRLLSAQPRPRPAGTRPMSDGEERDAITFRVKKSHLYVGFGLVVGFGFGYATATTIQRRAPSAPPVAESPAFSDLPVSTVSTEGRPSLGPPDAPVTVVEFSDYECPYCRRYFEETYRDLLERYEGSLRYVLRNFPIRDLHPLAQKAAEAAECAHEQGRFWEYHDLLFTRAPALGVPSLESYAAELGLDTEAFTACLGSGRKAEVVERDVQDGIRHGVRATPTFFINGRMAVGALPLDRFSSYVDAALREAESTGAGEVP